MSANRPPEAPQPARQFNVEVPSNLELVYSNFAIINHAPSEVMIDFGQLMPNTPQQIRVRARVMLTPMNAKRSKRRRTSTPARDSWAACSGRWVMSQANLVQGK